MEGYSGRNDILSLSVFFRSSRMRARNNTAPTSGPETTASGRESRSDGEEGSSSSGHNSPIEEKTTHTGKFYKNSLNLLRTIVTLNWVFNFFWR